MMGGLEKVQIEYINFLLSSGHDIKIIIENDNGKENVLEKYILGNKKVHLSPSKYLIRYTKMDNVTQQPKTG